MKGLIKNKEVLHEGMVEDEEVELEQVHSYLYAHIRVDLGNISICAGKNADDVMLMLHELLSRMMAGQFLKCCPPYVIYQHHCRTID